MLPRATTSSAFVGARYVGRVEVSPVGVDGHVYGPASARKRDCPRDGVRRSVEDRDGAATGVCDVDGPSVRRHRHLRRGNADPHSRDDLVGGAIDDRGCVVEVVGDVYARRGGGSLGGRRRRTGNAAGCPQQDRNPQHHGRARNHVLGPRSSPESAAVPAFVSRRLARPQDSTAGLGVCGSW